MRLWIDSSLDKDGKVGHRHALDALLTARIPARDPMIRARPAALTRTAEQPRPDRADQSQAPPPPARRKNGVVHLCSAFN